MLKDKLRHVSGDILLVASLRDFRLAEYYRILSELNNSFTHYSLVWNQFGLDYTEIFKDNPETLTKDYFENNPYRKT